MSAHIPNGSNSEHGKEKRSKWRLSNPFNASTNAKDGNSSDSSRQNDLLRARDSAYGGSETTSDTSPAMSSQGIPTITEGQARLQDAPVETRVDGRGRVITTTTTTVTTTTTTTEGEPYEVPPGEQVLVSNEVHPTQRQELSAQPSDPSVPIVPAKSDMRNRSPNNLHVPTQSGQPSAYTEPQHPRQDTYEQPPVSPTHQNFSYPSRQPLASPVVRNEDHGAPRRLSGGSNRPRPPMDPSYGQPPLSHHPPPPSIPAQYAQQSTHGAPPVRDAPYPPQQAGYTQDGPRHQSTAESLKTAAAGIHGAGETLRGAFNASVAKRTGGRPDEIARYETIAERGRQEIETGHLQHHDASAVQVSPVEAKKEEKKSRGLRNVLRKGL